jgi:hypothetical protein
LFVTARYNILKEADSQNERVSFDLTKANKGLRISLYKYMTGFDGAEEPFISTDKLYSDHVFKIFPPFDSLSVADSEIGRRLNYTLQTFYNSIPESPQREISGFLPKEQEDPAKETVFGRPTRNDNRDAVADIGDVVKTLEEVLLEKNAYTCNVQQSRDFPVFTEFSLLNTGPLDISNKIEEHGFVPELMAMLVNEEPNLELQRLFFERSPIGDNYFFETTAKATKYWKLDNNFIKYVQRNEEKYHELFTMISQLIQTINSKTRTYEQIVNKEKCYTEYLAFRVEQKIINPNGTISSEEGKIYYLYNCKDVLELVDNQVKNHGRYSYDIYAYVAVIGNYYKFGNYVMPEGPLSRQTYFPVIHLNNGQNLKIYEVKLITTKKVRILDKPPPAPDVLLTPFKGHKDKLLIWLNADRNQYEERVVVIEEEDERQRVDFAEAQGTTQTSPIVYSGDNKEKEFFVYRLDSQPTLWKSFSRRYRIVKSRLDASSVDFVDDLIPNKIYWYMFRTVDVSDHYSYPSHIFEVKLVEDNGMTFLQQKIFEFDDSASEKKEIAFKRNIVILPNPNNTTISPKYNVVRIAGREDSYEEEIYSQFSLGDDSSRQFWSKLYKIRVTSRATGKQIDFNIRFTKKNTISTEE